MNWIAMREGEQITLTPVMHRQILSGDMLVTIQGRIEYRDIFGNTHWLQFCQESGGGIMRPSVSDACAAYNATDEEQNADK
jgi:hypothetical protein